MWLRFVLQPQAAIPRQSETCQPQVTKYHSRAKPASHLLVLGMCFFFGGQYYHEQACNSAVAQQHINMFDVTPTRPDSLLYSGHGPPPHICLCSKPFMFEFMNIPCVCVCVCVCATYSVCAICDEFQCIGILDASVTMHQVDRQSDH